MQFSPRIMSVCISEDIPWPFREINKLRAFEATLVLVEPIDEEAEIFGTTSAA